MSLSPRSGDAPNLKFARNPVSRKQIEIVLSRSVAAGSLVFAAQTAAPLFAQLKENNLDLVDVIPTGEPLAIGPERFTETQDH